MNATPDASPARLAVASSAARDVDAAVAELRATLNAAGARYQHMLVFFSAHYEPERLLVALTACFPGVALSGCTTSGAILPAGMVDDGVLVIAFPSEGFVVHSELFNDVGMLGVERAGAAVRRMKSELRAGANGSNTFAILLVDGLSKAEETLVAAINWAIDDIQLVGGSAGDCLAFEQTAILFGGRVWPRSALLLMVETDLAFAVFKTQNFEPTPTKLVVTAADPTNRIVYELNAEPAAREYAAAIGLLPDDLGPFSFASYPLVVKVGSDYYCRSIRNMNLDGSLTFFCAIDEGLVFTVARPQDMVASTEQSLKDVERTLGGIDLVLGFDCILRRLDAENSQTRHLVEQLYRKYRVVGFHTYGEQYNAMHLNQTLTGIAFARTRRIP